MAGHDIGGWSAEPVDFDPFASVHDSSDRAGFDDGGGVDDDPERSVASGATGDINAQSAAGAGPLGRPGGIGGGASLRPAPGEAPSPGGLSAQEAAEVARARAAAGPYQPVTGLPQKIIGLPDGSSYVPGPLEKAHQAAEAYMRESGLPYDPPRDYAKIDKGFATRVAQAYEDMPHAPDDPGVRSSYDALARETMAQWQHVKNTGLKVDWITPQTGDPYAENPRMALRDIRDNNHWWGYPTDLGYGSTGEDMKAPENPMLADAGEEIGGHPARVNDIFRIVHDYFGHAKEGHGFRAEGEDNAFRSHAAMYSDAAKPAMASELRGQNSWLNFGPHGEANRTAKAADTIFADQKIGNMPEWTWRENMGRPITAPQVAGRAPSGLMGQEEAAQRQREGFEPPGEWTGGRIAMADGGALEPVEGNPFDLQPPDRTMQTTDLHRAMGFPEPRSPMHERICAAASAGRASSWAFAGGGGLEGKEEELQQQREIGTASGSEPTPEIRSPGLFGGARPVQPSAQFGESATTEPAVAPAAPAPTIVRSNSEGGVLRHVDPAFPEGRISTSAPWGKGATPHAQAGNDISMDLARGDDPLAGGLNKYLKGGYHKNANIIRGVDDTGAATGATIPYVRLPERQPGELTPEQHLAYDDATHEAVINHMESNIQAVHDAIPAETKQGSAQWYNGGHEITKQLALEQDIPHENAAGVVAALSPQKDWDMNVNLLGRRRVARHILPLDARRRQGERQR